MVHTVKPVQICCVTQLVYEFSEFLSPSRVMTNPSIRNTLSKYLKSTTNADSAGWHVIHSGQENQQTKTH